MTRKTVKSPQIEGASELDTEVEAAVAQEIERAGKKAWVAADAAGMDDEATEVASEVTGAVRHALLGRARRGADVEEIRAAARAVRKTALKEALDDRALDHDAEDDDGADEEDKEE